MDDAKVIEYEAISDDERVAHYRMAIEAIATAGRLVSAFDLPGMIEAIERGHSIGPLLDPTLYRDKAKAMDEDAEIFKAALPLWRLAKKLTEGRR